MDSFTGVSEQVIPINLNRIKARLRRNERKDQVATEISEIIALFEEAIETGLELASQLEAGDIAEASDIYRIYSTPEYELLWRRTYTLMRDVQKRI